MIELNPRSPARLLRRLHSVATFMEREADLRSLGDSMGAFAGTLLRLVKLAKRGHVRASLKAACQELNPLELNALAELKAHGMVDYLITSSPTPGEIANLLDALRTTSIGSLSGDKLRALTETIREIRSITTALQPVPMPEAPDLLPAIDNAMAEIIELHDSPRPPRGIGGSLGPLERIYRNVKRDHSATNPFSETPRGIAGYWAPGLAEGLSFYLASLERHEGVVIGDRATLDAELAKADSWELARRTNRLAETARRIEAGLDVLSQRIDQALTTHQQRTGEILRDALGDRGQGHDHDRGFDR